MIHYLFYQKNPASHYVYIDLTIDAVEGETMELALSAWRPGRYELGNFSKNIKRVDVFNENNVPLEYKKTTKDVWQIQTKSCKKLKVTYSYFAAELNAGACFADTNQLYINPVHCCMQAIGRAEEEHLIELQIPDNYKIATSLPVSSKTLVAKNYEELVDSPFIASANLQTVSYTISNITFYLHFNGICKPNWELYKKDFTAFITKMIEFWGDCPVKEYHFLFQVLTNKFYHGVEHQKNTVIAIGPGFNINNGATYEDVLGVSCHELFHCWNIKYIRPEEMFPYNYSKENYARTGYVYEGFTTYYGDKLLLSSNVFSLEQYFKTLEERLTKHFHNYGRYNLSVADSSWDTWLDGYVPGTPYRKTSIYDEGNLIAFILDVKILEATQNKKSLRDVCVLLYQQFGKQNKGYKEQDIINLVNEVSGKDFSKIFNDFVYTAADYEKPLQECFDYLGINFIKRPNSNTSEHYFGFKITDVNSVFARVTLVAPYSPGWKAGLMAGDEIISVNNILLKDTCQNWLQYFIDEDEITLMVNSNDQIKTLMLQKDKKGNTYFFNPDLRLKTEATEENKVAFEVWSKL
ncbi:MAG: M61 family peptidase [Bacteroidota bacterium]|nr:M61 family peptidase [Bacteroidota bacterium]